MTDDIKDYWAIPEFDLRKNQELALEWMQDELIDNDSKYIILELPVGCHLKGTKILMYDGSLKLVEDIQIHDQLMGQDSTPRNVLELHHGMEQMYTIKPIKGKSFVVNENHILSLISTNQRTSVKHFPSTLTGTEIVNISIKEYLNKSDDFKRHHKLYRSTGINFVNTKKLPIDSYIIGLFLGDGHICNGDVSLTTMDEEIVSVVYDLAKSYNLAIRITNNGSKASTYHVNTGKRGGDKTTREKNSLMEDMRSIGIYGTKSGDKFIPHVYKTASIEDRRKILAGLIDTDGHYDGTFQHVTKSAQLAEDIAFIARSLGLSAYINNKIINDVTYKTISISGELSNIPTLLKRKQASPRKQKKRVNVTGFSIEEYGIDDYYGFHIDSDNLYMLDDFTITHNSGKSILGVTLSRYLAKGLGSSFVLTPQRVLQDQYERDFKQLGKQFLSSLHGKSNYKCEGKGTSCKIGSLVKPACEHCPHKTAKANARNASNTVLNYKLALTSFQYTDTFEKRKLMILDEAHTLEQHLVDFDSVDITYAMCKKYDIIFKTQTEMTSAIDWLKEKYLPTLESELSDLEFDCEALYEKGEQLTRAEGNMIKETEELASHIADVLEMTTRTPEYVKENFVLTWDKTMFCFKRIEGSYSFHKIIKPIADRFLFMSSTILNKDTFCYDLGIKPEDVSFLSLPSEFEVENRPVIYMPVMKMNASWNKPENARGRNDMIERILGLLGIHDEDSGILHTANYAVAEWLVRELSGKINHNIYHHLPDGDMNRAEAINHYIDATLPSILISPSITEGLDLKDDLARFAMIVKTPFGYLGDQWIKRRMEMSEEWYRRRAIIGVIQGGGRIVRGLDDEGTVYILDGSFGYLYERSYNMVPQWWKDSFKPL